MKKQDEIIYYTIGEASELVERQPQTIKSWYRWAESEGLSLKEAGLPDYRRDFDVKKTFYFAEGDIPQLVDFRKKVRYGQMSEFNSKRWGNRGRSIEQRRATN